MRATHNMTFSQEKRRCRRGRRHVGAISEATIQVLLSDGVERLTTTRVAERAGVSVGTLYQYYPNKQSLLFAVLAITSTRWRRRWKTRVRRRDTRRLPTWSESSSKRS